MPNLTDADKKTFIGEIKNALTGNKDLLIAGNPEVPGSGWDPAQRVVALKAGEESVESLETTIANLEVALKSAVDARRAAFEKNYDIASATVSSVGRRSRQGPPAQRGPPPAPRQLLAVARH